MPEGRVAGTDTAADAQRQRLLVAACPGQGPAERMTCLLAECRVPLCVSAGYLWWPWSKVSKILPEGIYQNKFQVR